MECCLKHAWCARCVIYLLPLATQLRRLPTCCLLYYTICIYTAQRPLFFLLHKMTWKRAVINSRRCWESLCRVQRGDKQRLVNFSFIFCFHFLYLHFYKVIARAVYNIFLFPYFLSKLFFYVKKKIFVDIKNFVKHPRLICV